MRQPLKFSKGKALKGINNIVNSVVTKIIEKQSKRGIANAMPLLLCLVFLLSFAALAQAGAPIYVNGSCAYDGDGSVGGCALNAGDPGARNTIQAAVDQAAANSVVKIIPHSYLAAQEVTTYNENVTVIKEITLEVDTLSLSGASGVYAEWLVINGDAENNETGAVGPDKKGDDGNATIAWTGGVGGTLQNMTVTGGYSGADNRGIPRATAKVPCKLVIVICGTVRMRRCHRHDEARGAKTALAAMFFDHCGLHWVRCVACGNAFYCAHGFAVKLW